MSSLLSGKLVYVFLVSILDAAILSLAALWWFRRTVRALMRKRGGREANRQETSEASVGDSSAPEQPCFALFEPSRSASQPGRSQLAAEKRLRRPLVLAYALGAVAYSIVITGLKIVTESQGRPLGAWVALVWLNAWPLAPALIVLLVLDRRSALRAIAGYLGAGALAAASRSSESSAIAQLRLPR